MPSLNQYRNLFRNTLGVPNATIEMLVNELLYISRQGPKNDDQYQYVKKVLQKIARLRPKGKTLEALYNIKFWPCRTPSCKFELWSIGNFYVNDRQDLFDIFSDTYAFLNFDSETSRDVADFLRHQGSDFFLSEQVLIMTESLEPIQRDNDLTQEFRGRADAFVKYAIYPTTGNRASRSSRQYRYFDHAECESPFNLLELLQIVEL